MDFFFFLKSRKKRRTRTVSVRRNAKPEWLKLHNYIPYWQLFFDRVLELRACQQFKIDGNKSTLVRTYALWTTDIECLKWAFKTAGIQWKWATSKSIGIFDSDRVYIMKCDDSWRLRSLTEDPMAHVRYNDETRYFFHVYHFSLEFLYLLLIPNKWVEYWKQNDVAPTEWMIWWR